MKQQNCVNIRFCVLLMYKFIPYNKGLHMLKGMDIIRVNNSGKPNLHSQL